MIGSSLFLFDNFLAFLPIDSSKWTSAILSKLTQIFIACFMLHWYFLFKKSAFFKFTEG